MEIPYIVNARKDTGLNNSKIAIWLFLASEVMLFGGLFSSYIFLRIFADYPWPERALPVLPGLINTFILIASSVTVVYAWAALKLRKWPVFVANMSFTLICAAVFMFFKAKEYSAKFHHQSIQYNDWSIVEGHTYPEDKGGGNFYSVKADQVNFKLASYYGPYLDTILDRIGDGEIKIAADYKITDVSADGKSYQEKILVEAGEVVKADKLKSVLAEAKEYYINARTHNAEVRTAALRKAWKQVRANEGGNFTALQGKSHYEPEYKEVVNKLHTELVKANATGSIMLAQDSLAITLNEALIKVNPSWGRMNGKSVGETTSVDLKDSTSIKGKAADSGMKIAVDAIDFRHMVMKLQEKIDDGVEDADVINKAIAASPILKNEKIAKLWATHQQWLKLFTEHLKAKDLVPTHVDKYRVTWKQMVAYTRINSDDKLELTLETAKAQQPTMFEGFTGADHYNEEFKKAFTTISVPRDQIRFESVFSPKMNNYYAIYFTITGLHGLHVIGGALVLGYFLFFGYGMYKKNPDWLANRVEVAGLFWHFVDLVWIFVFPIFYLM